MLALALSAPLILAATEEQRHYHRGKLTKYKIGPPSLLLSDADEERLKGGHAVMQALVAEDGSRRMISVQDIKAPADVVMGRIVDFEKYDQMVQGVNSCVNYVSAETAEGIKVLKSRYTIHAAHLKMTYFMEHRYDPEQHCVVFHLDYERQSDLDDSVGYWYAQPRGPAECRVFYSTECKLRGWVPGPVYSLLTKKALGQATTWVSAEALKEWSLQQRGLSPNQRLVRFVSNVRSSLLQPAAHEGAAGLLSRGRRTAVRFANRLGTSAKHMPPMI